ncbi:putative LicD family-like protein 1 [Homarus americanus]|uniref:Putative LicD family-like protein 1 n=2 Tax=Homarus americanus TaxID=6706 RepID=A0A8J5MNG3_HOMAM|nr:putative LicD family-like protein 1 [Homarus americanus]
MRLIDMADNIIPVGRAQLDKDKDVVNSAKAIAAETQPLPCLQEPKESCSEGANILQVNYRRRVAFILSEVHREMFRMRGTTTTVDTKWVLKLGALVKELAPSMTNNSSWDYSARIPDMGPAPVLPNKTRHVCPEMYFGPKMGFSFHQHGMEPENCTYVPPFARVLTAVLPAMSWPPQTINFVITQIRKWYDIPIIVIIPKRVVVDPTLRDVKALKIKNETLSGGDLLNKAVEMVTTPYVFMGTSLAHFSNQSSLERLVRVLDELEHVKVAGGAARDLQGHWIHGCLQQRMADYQATYTMGYYYSKYECMYCDDVLTPFITTVKLVNKVAFTSSLSGPAVYRDWLAKVREAGHLTMVCPDVMFFLTNHVNMTSEDWLPMARHWALEKVFSYTGQVHNFSCDAVNITCKRPLRTISCFLLPPCCRAIISQELGYLIDYAKLMNIEYELQAGSALGAVKMGFYLPWDFDHDLIMSQHEYMKWRSINGPFLRQRKCYLNMNIHGRYFTIYCPYFFLELINHANYTSRELLPLEYRHIPTSIMYAGRWTIVSSNPALHTRNKLGIDYLKHAAHWRTLRVTNIGKAKGGYENPGTWNRCREPKHHSCQDRYLGDGNLPFARPFLHP